MAWFFHRGHIDMTWTCHFCGGNKNPTKEHVFPAWLLDELNITQQRTDAIHQTPLGMPRDTRTLTHNGMVLGKVCGDCNNGWMSQLESGVRPVLQAARSQELLHTADGELLAAWAFKTAIVLNRWSNYRKLAPDSHFKWLKEHGTPYPGVVVDLAYLPDGWHENIEGASRDLGYRQSMLQTWRLPKDLIETSPQLITQYQKQSYVIVLMVESCALRVVYCPVPGMVAQPLGKNRGGIFRLWPVHQHGIMQLDVLKPFDSMTHLSMYVQAAPDNGDDMKASPIDGD